MRRVSAALVLMLLTPASAHSSCVTMQALAQEHANDMARRGSMDHNGFASRARRGARAENVAYGVNIKQQAIALWWGSSGHAANMRLSGCKAVASAVGRDGKRYWVMVIGN
ncbi:MAG: CAP domain-containing protein [Pseudolabrys sp.]